MSLSAREGRGGAAEERKRNAFAPIVSLAAIMLASPVLLNPGSVFAREFPEPKETGRITGTVRTKGTFQKPPPLKVYKNRDICGPAVADESLLVGRDGGLQNAVLILARSPGDKPASPSSLVLDNKNCAFVPHVQVAPLGSELLLLNSDPILHNVHARIGPETLFNVGLPTWRRVKQRLNRTGIIAIDCNVLHTWMRAYIVVTSSPHFAVTDQNGEFSIEGVPAGNYEIELWHEKLGRRSRSVALGPGSALRLDFFYAAASADDLSHSHGRIGRDERKTSQF